MKITLALLFIALILIIIITGVEYAYLTSNKLTIELKRKKGTEKGRIAASFFDLPERFFGGTTFILYILLVAFCFLISKTTIWLTNAISPNALTYINDFAYVGIILDTVIATIIILTSAGYISKKVFEYNPENKLTSWSRFISFLCDIANPFVQLFTSIAQFILKYLFNVRMVNKQQVFEKVNIQQFVTQSIEGHTIQDERNKELFEKALKLSRIKVRKCLIPRNEVIAVDIHAPIQVLKDKYIQTKQSKIVIYEGNLDNIVGYTHHIDINKRPNSIKDILLPIIAVPETMNAIDLLYQFTKERKSIAWVVDEFGGTAGFTNLEDILEVIFGDIRYEYDISEYTEKEIGEGEYIISGRLPISYINKKFHLDIYEDDEEQTLSGYIINNHTKIPNLRDKIIIDHLEFEILLVTATRIETVRVKRLNF